MNFLGWHIGPRTEHRAVTFTQDATAAGLAQAETPSVKADTLAVVESCVSLISEPFLVARLTGPLKSLRTLYVACRDVQRYGNSVWAIDTETGVLNLQRAHKFRVFGQSLDPDTWEYELELMAPDGVVKKRLPAPAVVHIRLPGNSDSDWLGCAPWQNASLSADAMAEIERGVRDEGRAINGRVWLAPDAASQEQVTAMANTVRKVKGGNSVVAETTAAGWGQSKAAAPERDWTAVKMGQDHTQGNVIMRDGVQAALAAAYGVPGAYFNPNATAPALREIKRLTFLNKTLPLAAMASEELSNKLPETVEISWPNLADQSIDVHLRARAAEAAQELVQNMEALLTLVGLPKE